MDDQSPDPGGAPGLRLRPDSTLLPACAPERRHGGKEACRRRIHERPQAWRGTGGEVRKEAFVIAAVAFAISGCARTPFPVIESQLSGLKEHPVKKVSDKLGDPSSNAEINGEKAYIWSLPNTTSFYYGALGLQCTVRVFVDKDDKVTHYDFAGNVGGCGYYAHRLDDSYHVAAGILEWNNE